MTGLVTGGGGGGYGNTGHEVSKPIGGSGGGYNSGVDTGLVGGGYSEPVIGKYKPANAF